MICPGLRNKLTPAPLGESQGFPGPGERYNISNVFEITDKQKTERLHSPFTKPRPAQHPQYYRHVPGQIEMLICNPVASHLVANYFSESRRSVIKEAKRTKSLAESRDEIFRPPNLTPPPPGWSYIFCPLKL